MNLKNTLRTGALALFLPAIAAAQTFGYNAAEAGVTNNATARVRTITNVDTELGIGFHGVNDFEDDWYFGRNSLLVGKDKQRFAIVTKATEDGIFNVKIGVRDTSITEKLGGYGWMDVTTDLDSLNVTTFYGRPFGNSSLEWTQALEVARESKPGFYTELQFNRKTGPHTDLFARLESTNFATPDYLVGITLRK